MKFLSEIQSALEDAYGARTGLDVRDFVIPRKDFKPLGSLVVAQDRPNDLDVALFFDRDILEAFEASQRPEAFEASQKPEALEASQHHRAVTVSMEEVSHFVYLSFNHGRGRNVTALEMEMQSEVDRILLGFHGPLALDPNAQDRLLEELLERPYPEERYEESRRAAARFIRSLSGGDPRAWSPREREFLRRFFHSDLAEKLALAGRKAP
jgi:hypothetical protein